MIVVKNLVKRYGKKCVLSNISFEMENQIIGLLGPNGAGKTTLLRILSGIIEKNNGEFYYINNIGKRTSLYECNIGYLPQNFGLIKDYTLYEHMQYFSCMKGIPQKSWREEIERVLQMVHLENMNNVKCGKLSGGMVRRVGIAQAFLGKPKLILLDEPTTGLDPEERIRFQNIINSIKGKCTIIISTHIVNDVTNMCDKLMILNHGQILYMGEIEELIEVAQGKVYEMTKKDSINCKNYGINVKNGYNEDGNEVIRFLYLGKEKYINPNARELVAEVEDGYLYLLKRHVEEVKEYG